MENKITIGNILEAAHSLPSSSKPQPHLSNDATKTSFDDIGGYVSIKQQLREVFLWPVQFAEVYKSVGIRIGNGAILYGPSGCGKTLLARALATEIEFNVTHVKV